MTSTKSYLSKNWTFAQLKDTSSGDFGEWLSCSEMPTTVHAELIKQKKIPDPFLGMNEWEVQWVGEATWVFKTTFSVSDEELKKSGANLVFEGLDTYASVNLNGHQILETNNQFVTYRADVKRLLVPGDSNVLVITFPSTFLKGKDLEERHGKLALWNGDSSRLHVRKAQYNYGWDWGPVLLTVGPWRPIYLHTYTAYVSDYRLSTVLSPEFSEATLFAAVTLTPPIATATARVTLKSSDNVVRQEEIKWSQGGAGKLEWNIPIGGKKDEVDLWWPVGYGEQKLYDVEIQVIDERGDMLDELLSRIGFRDAQVIQEPLIDQEGRSFLFQVNGVRIFCGGSNWIPADSFLTTVPEDRYRSWLQLMVDGNQNMVRVWAGGIYESDIFYDICDELGIMVWQDFAFGCGQYPAYDEFIERLIPEAEQNVVRVRHHPSLVIFAGNNEDYQVAESLKLELDYSDETSDFRSTNFPARYIYERVLPDIVERLSDVHYHRASPYSGFHKPTTDKNYGDLHQWNVWHGSQEPWHNWDILAGRFVSEFGMQGFPDIRTVDYWLDGKKEERYPQSRTMNQHNKADGFERRLELYLVENFKHAFDIESYVYYTQVMQAETLASAYRLWRRNWRGKGREYTAGALVWQLNDCWPVTSWAIVDYFLRPKPAYFAIARELRQHTIGMTRREVKLPSGDGRSAAFFTLDTSVEVWGTNSQLSDKPAKLVLEAFDLDVAEWRWKEEKEVILAANSSTELWKGQVPGQPLRHGYSEPVRTIIISGRLLSGDGAVLARYVNWPEPFKYIKFPSVEALNLKLEVTKPDSPSDAEQIRLSSDRPIKGIVLSVEGEGDVKWSDQAIDLVPGDEQVVQAWGLKGRKIHTRFLGDGSA